MAIKLFNYALSGSCYKVRLMLDFLELDYECESIGFYPVKQHKTVEFLAINPLGQIPVLDDDGVRLRDAQAILCHLANKYDSAGTWLPRNQDAFGAVMMWLVFAGGEIMAASAARLHDVMDYPIDIELARSNAHKAFRVLDDHLAARQLSGHDWIASEHPTIADVACFPYIALSGEGGIGLEDYPYIRNWLLKFRKLPKFDPMPGISELR